MVYVILGVAALLFLRRRQVEAEDFDVRGDVTQSYDEVYGQQMDPTVMWGAPMNIINAETPEGVVHELQLKQWPVLSAAGKMPPGIGFGKPSGLI